MKNNDRQDLRTELTNKLIKKEAEIGGKIFGELPKGHRREFFCLDQHTWIWHEEWINARGLPQTTVTRYDVRPGGILKSQNGTGYHTISGSEAINLRKAAEVYTERVSAELYPA